MQRLQRWLKPSPETTKTAIVSLFFATLFTGTLANLKSLFYQRPLFELAPAASPVPQAAPQVPLRRVEPTPAPAIVTRLERPLRSLGAAAPSPRRYEYSVQTTLRDASKVIPLPPMEGTVDVVLGPLVIAVPAGETVEWDPRAGDDVTTVVRLVFAASDTPATDEDHAVQLWGVGDDAPAPDDIRTLDPVALLPESLSLPFHIRNTTSRDAKVTLRVWLNTSGQGGPGGDD